MKKVLTLTLTVLMVLGSMVGCAQTPEAAAPAAPAAADAAVDPSTLFGMIDPNEEYILVNCMNNIEYFNAIKYGWQIAGEQFGVKVSFTGPADADVNEMISAMESAIAKKPAGICLFGFYAELDSYIDKALDAGIPVVIYNGDLGRDDVTYIGTSAYDLGYQGAKQYAESIQGQGTVAILTMSAVPLHEDRCEGFEDGFAEYPGIEIVAYGDTKADATTATSVSKDIAIKYPDLTGFICTDSTGATGAATALAELGLTGTVDVLGLDRNTDALELIKDGTITGTLAQNDVSQSYWSLVCLVIEAHYDMPLSSDNAAANAKVTPNDIYTSVNYITKENVDYYITANELYATNIF